MVSVSADTIVVPLASEADAKATCEALDEYLEDGDRIVLVHVVEKAGGAPDKVSVEQRAEYADGLFAAARAHLEGRGRTVDAELYYGTDVADTIFRAAGDVEADLVVFSPREASRLARFLSGDTALNLVSSPEFPVLVLPPRDA